MYPGRWTEVSGFWFSFKRVSDIPRKSREIVLLEGHFLVKISSIALSLPKIQVLWLLSKKEKNTEIISLFFLVLSLITRSMKL